jgi:ppGpp synthetase/RelA/SpoT-type nucleotidyltranferase
MDLENVRAEFLSDEQFYADLCRWASDKIDAGLKHTAVYAPVVDGRPKDLLSYLKKVMRKGYDDPLRQITDRAGLRIVVTFPQDVPDVESVITDLFTSIERIDKAEGLEDDQLGYLGIHHLVISKEDDDEARRFAGITFEVQIHTRAQNAWASASHRLLYKPPTGAVERGVRRRVNRLVALVELFDQEVRESWNEIVSTPGYEQGAMLIPLEREYVRVSDVVEFDEALSLVILAAVRNAYTESELERFGDLIHEYMARRSDYLRQQMDANPPESSSPILFQPEVIAILERLETAAERLRVAWDAQLPAKWLDSLSEELGRPA